MARTSNDHYHAFDWLQAAYKRAQIELKPTISLQLLQENMLSALHRQVNRLKNVTESLIKLNATKIKTEKKRN
jgi:hypothetical protein